MEEGDPEPSQATGLDVRGLEVIRCTGYLGYPVRPTVTCYMGKRSQDGSACSLASALKYSQGEHVTGREGKLIPLEQVNEQHPHGGDWLREIVFGLNDGLVTTLVFIMAVSQIAPARLLLVVLGEVLAGGISMALGGYLSALTAKQIRVRSLQDLEQEPRAAFRLIEDLLQYIARGCVTVLVAHGNRLP